MILNYHVTIFPFHIASIPFEILFPNDFLFLWMTPMLSNGRRYFPKNFINFWMFPLCFYSIFRVCFARLILFNSLVWHHMTINIKPVENTLAVQYFLAKKHKVDLFDILIFIIWLLFLWSVVMSVGGFVLSAPFLPFFMINGESYDE